ncbi:MAG: Crp/Fnr family transcriptional regulator [Erythrobacter sp.]|uniref:Crp/Fnr family transcriptional regulator n=1 Tax=Erythrobacter sp. TaxID=1042 RepID=UPI00262A6503|nr:Crp/Fnr family transcriptional regulator [Erythrobacter sp.]MDJ0977326.1 Crp/Fnr family transcriptional regulator [Erythrobacter sp.]
MSRFQELVVEHGREIELQPGDHLFAQGEHDSRVFMVKSGLLKAYYIRVDGKEHIKSFLPEGSIIGSMVSLVDGDPCSFSLQAIEASLAVALPYSTVQQAAQSDIELANALIAFLSTYGKRKERREYELLSLSPEKRYAILLAEMPGIVERVSQADMAAYIGVTPQALSRIRRRMSR